jgi:hypothetical protein
MSFCPLPVVYCTVWPFVIFLQYVQSQSTPVRTLFFTRNASFETSVSLIKLYITGNTHFFLIV